jgi:hypothetical protein
MSHFYDRYQRGFYQEVYDDLLAMQEQVFDDELIYRDAVLVAKTMMQRVKYNIEVLIPRLADLKYQFAGSGLVKNSVRNSLLDESGHMYETSPVFHAPEAEMSQKISNLEQHFGSFPLSLKYWYEEVGSVNLIGVLPAAQKHVELSSVLDPLFVFSPDFLIGYFSANPVHKEGKVEIPLAPDGALKYGYSGGGPYTVEIPCIAFDANFELDRKSMTFVNYLRICFQWGGFFGLYEARENERLKLEERTLSSEELTFLTKDLLPF